MKNDVRRKSPDPMGMERSSQIIGAMLDENNPQDLRDRMVSWFNSDMSENEKFAAMENYMNETLEESEEYDDFTREKFSELKQKLNIQQETEKQGCDPPAKSKDQTHLIFLTFFLIVIV